MPCRQTCSNEENIIRCIRSSDWDQKRKRWSSNLFCGPETSVSRTKILPIKRLEKIFCSDLHKPPNHKVLKTGEIKVGELKKLGEKFEVNGKLDKRIITVVEDPICNNDTLNDNPAHALVMEKLPRSLSFNIIANLNIRNSPPCWFITAKWYIALGVFAISSILIIAMYTQS